MSDAHLTPFDDTVSQLTLQPARDLRSRVDDCPRVLVAILAKQKEKALPLFLRCIEALDYPKSSIVLYVRTNNNTDRTEQILRDWIGRIGPSYAQVDFDAAPVEEPVETFGQHEWNETRFRVLGNIRNGSLSKTSEHASDFYFVCDVDNFIRPCTLRELVALKLPIVAPLLRVTDPNAYYSNFFAEIDPHGFYGHCDQYQWILHRRVRGVFEVPVVHCTYLIRADVIPQLGYLDGSNRYEFVVFSDSARKAGIQQYIDNRQVYGYITFDADSDAARGIIGAGKDEQIAKAEEELARDAGYRLRPARTWTKADPLLKPGISFIVRVRNEEQFLARSLQNLQHLTIPHEIVVILHLCTDRSSEIARSFPGVRVFEYDRPISRAGFETLVTAAASPHSLITYYNWCFSKAEYLWCFKWDADCIASPELIEFLNGRTWDDATPMRIQIPRVNEGAHIDKEPFLFNAGRNYTKWVFWEHNASIHADGVEEECILPSLTHLCPLTDAHIKSYWRAEPWFGSTDSPEGADLRQKYRELVGAVGPEPVGLARAANNALVDDYFNRVCAREAELKLKGINLWF